MLSGARARLALGGCLLAVLVFLAYAPAIPGGFIWDDNLLVPGNPLITSVDGFPAIWSSGSSMDYIPLTLSSFRIEWRLWNGNPIGYHLVNILLHSAGAFLLWRVLRKLSIPGAFLGAVIFVVHPVNVASVAWIAERKNTLSLVFYLLAVLWYLDFHAQRSPRYYTLALVAACCAFLSKGSTVILPAVLIGCVWWIEGTVRRRDWLACAPFAALAGIMASVTIHFQAAYILPASEHLSLAFRVIRAGDAVWFYLWKDFWPVNLCAIYPKWQIDIQSPPAYLPALLVVACVIGLWLQRGGWGRGPFFAASYFLVNLLPVLGFVNMGFMDQAYVADWWQQIALAGPAALAGAGLATLWRRASTKLRPMISAGVAVIVVLLAVAAWNEARAYQSADAFWSRVIAGNPGSWGAHDNLGDALYAEGKLDEAVAQFNEAIRLNPGSATTYLNLADALRAQGKADLAMATYEAALRLDPGNAAIRNNLGVALAAAGKRDESIAQYREALRADPNSAQAHNNLGDALIQEGKIDDGVAEYREALRINPGYAAAHESLGNVLFQQGKIGEGIAEYSEALRINPGDAAAHGNLGVALHRMGRTDEAIAQYREALRLSPTYAEFHCNLANALLDQGKLDEAIAEYRETLRINPTYAAALTRLDLALKRKETAPSSP